MGWRAGGDWEARAAGRGRLSKGKCLRSRSSRPLLFLTSLSSAEESFPYFMATPEFMTALFRAELLLLRVSELLTWAYRARDPPLGPFWHIFV